MIKKVKIWSQKPQNEKWNSIFRTFSHVFNSKKYAHFGKRSLIRKPMNINGKKNISIGDHVTIRDGARIECIDNWNGKKQISKPILEIHNNVSIEQRVHIACAKRITIGNNVTISLNVVILDCTHSTLPIDKNILQNELIARPVTIDDYAFIGTGVVILPGVRIGRNAIIGANSVVNRNIPDYCIAAGVPARIIKQYNNTTKCWEPVKNCIKTEGNECFIEEQNEQSKDN